MPLPAITSEVKLVSPELAKSIRAGCHFERQRKLSEANISRLAYEMSHGHFVQGTPIFFGVLPDKAMYLVNGNHTLEAIMSSTLPQLLTFIYHPCTDLEEVASLYATFDANKPRTWGDSLKAVGMGEKLPYAPQVASAVRMILANFKSVSGTAKRQGVATIANSKSEVFAKLHDFERPARLIHDALAGAPGSNQKLLLRVPVLAVLLEIARAQPSEAFNFIKDLAADDGLKLGDPRKTLLRFLTNNYTTQGDDRFLMCRAVAQAWNAYYQERELQILRPGSMSNITLAGTRWTGDTAAPKIVKTGLGPNNEPLVIHD